MSPQVRIGLVSTRGIGPERGGRDQNEDNYLVARHGRARFLGLHDESSLEADGPGVMVVVADGMGGHDHGALASGAAVQAEVIDQIKGDKVIHFVKRRRKHSSKRTKGHRQQLTLIRVTDILAEGADKSGVKAAIGAGSVTGAPAAAAPKAEKAAPKAEAPKADAAAGDDLTKITGVGPAAAKKLNDAGITSFAQLAEVDVDSFDAVKIKPEWTQQAKELAGK